MKATPALLLTLVVACVIALGTLSPSGDGPALPVTDKHLHAMAFAILVLPLGWRRPDWAVGLFIGAILFGGAIELLQPLVSRSREWGDLFADALGAGIGLVPGLLRKRTQTQRS